MSTDTYKLLTNLRSIYEISDFDEDDMSADLGQALCDINAICAELLTEAGWPLPGHGEDLVDPNYINNVRIPGRDY